jgi:hypothetical protein
MAIPTHRPKEDEFGLEIRFERNSVAPSRVFRGVSAYIEAFELIDVSLASVISTNIQPILLLEDIEAASILVWLKNVLQGTDDEALKSGDYKRVIGSYLVKAKYAVIDFCEKRTTVNSREEIGELQERLLQTAIDADIFRIPMYQPIRSGDIADSLRLLSEASAPLGKSDRVIYLTESGNVEVNTSFAISPGQIGDILVREESSYDAPMILKVKKPDFIGASDVTPVSVH